MGTHPNEEDPALTPEARAIIQPRTGRMLLAVVLLAVALLAAAAVAVKTVFAASGP
jgi:hypothetical protein